MSLDAGNEKELNWQEALNKEFKDQTIENVYGYGFNDVKPSKTQLPNQITLEQIKNAEQHLQQEPQRTTADSNQDKDQDVDHHRVEEVGDEASEKEHLLGGQVHHHQWQHRQVAPKTSAGEIIAPVRVNFNDNKAAEGKSQPRGKFVYCKNTEKIIDSLKKIGPTKINIIS